MKGAKLVPPFSHFCVQIAPKRLGGGSPAWRNLCWLHKSPPLARVSVYEAKCDVHKYASRAEVGSQRNLGGMFPILHQTPGREAAPSPPCSGGSLSRATADLWAPCSPRQTFWRSRLRVLSSTPRKQLGKPDLPCLRHRQARQPHKLHITPPWPVSLPPPPQCARAVCPVSLHGPGCPAGLQLHPPGHLPEVLPASEALHQHQLCSLRLCLLEALPGEPHPLSQDHWGGLPTGPWQDRPKELSMESASCTCLTGESPKASGPPRVHRGLGTTLGLPADLGGDVVGEEGCRCLLFLWLFLWASSAYMF